MNRVWPLVLVAAVLTTLSLAASPGTARGQDMCAQEHDSLASACVLGMPDAQGVTVRDSLDSPAQMRAYRFRVGEAAAAYIYVGDLWYDLAVALWRDCGQSVDITSSYKCPAQMWREGRAPNPQECADESFVSRAICQ